MRHKHADAIIAWADGKVVQFRENSSKDWQDIFPSQYPGWYLDYEYRPKPEEVVTYTDTWNAFR